jgi:hypothetical protein
MSTPRLSLSAAIGRLRWPLPALLSWCAGWALWSLARSLGATELNAYAAGVLGALWLAWPCAGAWRVAIAGAGFPLSALALGAGTALPSWAWLLMLLPVLALYPLRAWRDAPFFPTPADALAGLDGIVPAPRRALDAGCGLGHGCAAATPRCAGPTCGRARGPATTSSTFSSAPKAWRAYMPRPSAKCRARPGS